MTPNGPPEDMHALAADVQVLKVETRALSQAIASLTGAFQSFQNNLNESRQFKWPVALAAVGAAAVIFSFISRDAEKNTMIASKTSENEMLKVYAPIAAKADISEKDRIDIRATISRNGDRISASENGITSLLEKITELETQARSNSQIRSLITGYEHAFVSILWKDMKGTDLPPVPFNADISLPKPSAPAK